MLIMLGIWVVTKGLLLKLMLASSQDGALSFQISHLIPLLHSRHIAQ